MRKRTYHRAAGPWPKPASINQPASTGETATMTAPAFLHPAFARTAPNPEPLRWDQDRDIRALAVYIRAWLLQTRAGVRRPS